VKINELRRLEGVLICVAGIILITASALIIGAPIEAILALYLLGAGVVLLLIGIAMSQTTVREKQKAPKKIKG
jgi:uncharacterized membrane protein HdeD (DUF308 family)